MFPIRKNPGSALLIVLAMTALASAAVLAFFTMAGTERTAANFQKNSEAARNLANSATQVVMGSIVAGTKGGTAAAPLAWASQPGMIRTYNTTGATQQFYKLYSAANMTVSSFTLTDDLPPSNWRSSPGVWVDLNSPVADSGGTLNYPILDPAADPGTTSVKPTGFSINASVVGYAGGNASATNNPAPMPVRWLYQLKDGTLVPGTGSGNTTTVTGATTANPIVGRIAFWADDETCKVNINTAAEGTYWDTPRFWPISPDRDSIISGGVPVQSLAWQYPDFAFASYQPAQFEFQRYPGHPAQVALSSVFPSVTSNSATILTPRLTWNGTTQGSTVWAGNSTVDLSKAPRKALYATIDEYQFSGNYSSANRSVNVLPSGAITKNDLEAAKFFITANSRTPEVNMLNLPRIACWPVDRSLSSNASLSTNRTTAFDRLLAFCSSTGNATQSARLPYYFQRFDAQSPTNDYSNIPRNQQLYSYLQRLTAAAVPGFGGNFLSKYGADRDQILTEIFDYIRCTNLIDPNLPGFPINTPAVDGKPWPRITNQFVPAIRTPSSDNGSTNLLGLGQVMPIRINNTVGFGRFAAIKELAFVFVCVGDGALPSTSTCTSNTTVDAYIADAGLPTKDEVERMVSNMPAPNTNGLPATAPAAPIVSDYLATNPSEWTRVRQKWSTAIASFVALRRNKNNTNGIPPYNQYYPGYNLALEGTALLPTERRLQIMVLFRLNVPAAGMLNYIPDLLFRIQGLESVGVSNAFNIGPFGGTGPLFSLPANCTDWIHKTKQPWSRAYTNPLGFDVLIGGNNNFTGLRPPWYSTNATNQQPVVVNNPSLPYYPFISRGFTLNASTANSAINFGGADLTFELYQGKNVYDPKNTELGIKFKDPAAPPLSSVLGNPDCLHQTANIKFPSDNNIPIPGLETRLNGVKNIYNTETRMVPGNAGADVLSDLDVVRSRCFNSDGRLAAVMTSIPSSAFVPYSPVNRHQLGQSNTTISYQLRGAGSQTSYSGMIPPNTNVTTGDFDMACRMGPGGFINKPDEGDNSRGTLNNSQNGALPYYFYAQDASNYALYTPNRIMPSAGMFGSLLTSAKAGVGWQTLLFRPQPSHPNYSTTIPDHLIMDLFWMPIVEPYALSENFSTAGKVNMNYQILPFTYVNRPTALIAAMKVEMGSAVPSGSTFNGGYWYLPDPTATGTGDPITGGTTWRKNFNLSETNGTLRQFREKFASGQIFRSATEICDIYLVPRDQTWTSDSAAVTFWNNNLNTPENLREKPYANLYARLTTKSNTFTIHVRAQALQKVPGTPADQWIEGRDKVVAEERMSSVVERYLDADNGLPDFATDTTALLSDYYRMRVLSTKKFAP